MLELRPFASLGKADHGWLQAHHHFSFANYHNPNRIHWGRLRVWNDDTIQAGTGFDPHPHKDMEIITYVRKGAISHRDNLGNSGKTMAGDVQVMSAGTGIRHSEYNLEDSETQIFQIWIMPDQTGYAPRWGTRPFPRQDRANSWTILASGMDGDIDALPINTNARVSGAILQAGHSLTYNLTPECYAYLVPASGAIKIGALKAKARDGIAITQENSITITAVEDSELVLVDTL